MTVVILLRWRIFFIALSQASVFYYLSKLLLLELLTLL